MIVEDRENDQHVGRLAVACERQDEVLDDIDPAAKDRLRQLANAE